MKKAIVILVITLICSFVMWVLVAFTYLALNNFPKDLPHIFYFWAFIILIHCLTIIGLWAYSLRHIIISEIKHYLNS